VRPFSLTGSLLAPFFLFPGETVYPFCFTLSLQISSTSPLSSRGRRAFSLPPPHRPYSRVPSRGPMFQQLVLEQRRSAGAHRSGTPRFWPKILLFLVFSKASPLLTSARNFSCRSFSIFQHNGLPRSPLPPCWADSGFPRVANVASPPRRRPCSFFPQKRPFSRVTNSHVQTAPFGDSVLPPRCLYLGVPLFCPKTTLRLFPKGLGPASTPAHLFVLL